jgi:hypothetical protein
MLHPRSIIPNYAIVMLTAKKIVEVISSLWQLSSRSPSCSLWVNLGQKADMPTLRQMRTLRDRTATREAKTRVPSPPAELLVSNAEPQFVTPLPMDDL